MGTHTALQPVSDTVSAAQPQIASEELKPRSDGRVGGIAVLLLIRFFLGAISIFSMPSPFGDDGWVITIRVPMMRIATMIYN